MYTSRRLRLTVVALAVFSIVVSAAMWLAVRSGASDIQKMRAAQTLLNAERAILAAHESAPEALSVTRDPLQAALLGPHESPITTDAGVLSSKLTATNPNFAAAIVDMLRGAGVGPGDVVAIAYTGSFPVLDLGTVIAVETLGAEPIIASSVGASNWGATDPSFTILDMESLLLEQGLIQHRSSAAAVGGSLRRASMSETGRGLALQAIQRNGIQLIQPTDIRNDVDEVMQVYRHQTGDRPLKAFVNVGGGQVSIGGSTYRDRFAPGLQIVDDASSIAGHGLLATMQRDGVPTIHLDEVRVLAERYKLPMAPSKTPELGQGGPFLDSIRVRVAAGIAAVVLLAGTLGARLLVMTPATSDEFDPYFGTLGHKLKRRIRLVKPRASTTRRPELIQTGSGAPQTFNA